MHDKTDNETFALHFEIGCSIKAWISLPLKNAKAILTFFYVSAFPVKLQYFSTELELAEMKGFVEENHLIPKKKKPREKIKSHKNIIGTDN